MYQDDERRSSVPSNTQQSECQKRTSLPGTTHNTSPQNSVQVAGNMLSETEQLLLKKTWTADSDERQAIGEKIYSNIFTRQPSIAQLFPRLCKADGTVDENSSEFRKQALRFVTVINEGVINFSRGGERCLQYDAKLERLGRDHFKYGGRGFNPEMWNGFTESMVYVLTERVRWTDILSEHTAEHQETAVKAWRQLAVHIVDKMNQGFKEAEKKANDQS